MAYHNLRNYPHLEQKPSDPGHTVITATCPECKGSKAVPIDNKSLSNWLHGDLIQRAMASIDEDDRERLITGYCPSCWNKLFADDDVDLTNFCDPDALGDSL